MATSKPRILHQQKACGDLKLSIKKSSAKEIVFTVNENNISNELSSFSRSCLSSHSEVQWESFVNEIFECKKTEGRKEGFLETVKMAESQRENRTHLRNYDGRGWEEGKNGEKQKAWECSSTLAETRERDLNFDVLLFTVESAQIVPKIDGCQRFLVHICSDNDKWVVINGIRDKENIGKGRKLDLKQIQCQLVKTIQKENTDCFRFNLHERHTSKLLKNAIKTTNIQHNKVQKLPKFNKIDNQSLSRLKVKPQNSPIKIISK